MRHVDNVRLHHHRASSARRRVQRRHGSVVRKAVVPAHDAEADDVALVVQDLQPLGAADRGQPGYDADLPEGPDVAVSDDHVAALDEVLVRLRVVEAADDGPHGGDGGEDVLAHGGAALVGAHRVGVVAGHVVRDLCGGGVAVGLFAGRGGGSGWGFVDSLEEEGRFWRHFHRGVLGFESHFISEA